MNVSNVNTFKGFKVRSKNKIVDFSKYLIFIHLRALWGFCRMSKEKMKYQRYSKRSRLKKGQYKSHNTTENLFKGL
jgi:hypothetical protein